MHDRRHFANVKVLTGLRSWGREIILDYLHGPSITTRVLLRVRQESQSEIVGEGAVTAEAEVRVMPLVERAYAPKERGWPLEAGKARNR